MSDHSIELNFLCMKILSLALTGLFFLAVSCGNDDQTDGGNKSESILADSSAFKPGTELTGCYIMIQGKDTATLELTVADSTVSGNLNFKRFEKDSNQGTIDGVIRDGLILANYAFQSEGRRSVREVVFLMRGESLLEGYGEIEVKGDSAKFVNITGLKFLPTPFIKTNCAK